MAEATRNELRQVVREFNDVMNLKPPIKISGTVPQLLERVKEGADELRDDDKFSSGVEETLVKLEIRKAMEAAGGDKTETKMPTKIVKKGTVERSCFGSSLKSQAGAIDMMLEKGADLETISKKIPCSKSRIRSHLVHLEKKGFKVKDDKGVISVEN